MSNRTDPQNFQNEVDVLKDVAGRLEGAGMLYMLTGSLAMGLYATPRFTRDVDLVVELRPKDANEAVALFENDYYISAEAVAQAIKRESIFNAIHFKSAIKVDFIIRKSSPYRIEEFSRRRRLQVPRRDFEVWITSREDLILSKLWWAKDSLSEVQIGDIKNLLPAGCDMAYIEKWATELGLMELWNACRT